MRASYNKLWKGHYIARRKVLGAAMTRCLKIVLVFGDSTHVQILQADKHRKIQFFDKQRAPFRKNTVQSDM